MKNYYQRQIDSGRQNLEEIARNADARQARGESTGPPSILTHPINRRYDSPGKSNDISLSSVPLLQDQPQTPRSMHQPLEYQQPQLRHFSSDGERPKLPLASTQPLIGLSDSRRRSKIVNKKARAQLVRKQQACARCYALHLACTVGLSCGTCLKAGVECDEGPRENVRNSLDGFVGRLNRVALRDYS